MRDEETPKRLSTRARSIGLEIPVDVSAALVDYYKLLSRWNRKINLTSLSDPDAAVDRLLLEPLLAARYLPRNAAVIDLGSGGGSPAIPLAMGTGARLLVMVESRGRKAAFLREASRQLNFPAVVETSRFEDVASRDAYRHAMDVVSIRAVRVDEPTLSVAATFARPGGRVALFASSEPDPGQIPRGLRVDRSTPLLERSMLFELVAV